MKKFARQSGINFIILILVCIIGRIAAGNTYSQYVSLYYSSRDSKTFSVEQTDGDGRASIELMEVRDGRARIKLHAESPGRVDLEIRDEAGAGAAICDFRIGRFGTIYSLTIGGFTGDSIMMFAIMLYIFVESLLLFMVFRRAKGASFYSYNTIYAAGFSLFLFLTGILLLMETVRHIMDPLNFIMISVYSNLSSAGYRFMVLTFPLIFLFAVSMTLSNIALLRHERPRLQNVLGILISFLMVAGAVASIFIVGVYFMGSETEYRIRQTLQNVYCTAYAYFECMLIGAVICGIKAARHIPKGPVDYILILGCGFRKDGTLPPLLRGRVDRAIAFWKDQKEKGKTAILVPSGGQGPDEVMPEAEAMRRYLAAEGIPEEYILPEKESKNTYENMFFSKKLIENEDPEARVIYSTTNYHVFRSGVWASLAGLKAEGIGSKTKWWYWPNAFMRECIGLLANRWKQELVFLVLLLILFGAISLVTIM
jgi:uncharacterized SAM-binding protein YcdF (DUF218 family)